MTSESRSRSDRRKLSGNNYFHSNLDGSTCGLGAETLISSTKLTNFFGGVTATVLASAASVGGRSIFPDGDPITLGVQEWMPDHFAVK